MLMADLKAGVAYKTRDGRKAMIHRIENLSRGAVAEGLVEGLGDWPYCWWASAPHRGLRESQSTSSKDLVDVWETQGQLDLFSVR